MTFGSDGGLVPRTASGPAERTAEEAAAAQQRPGFTRLGRAGEALVVTGRAHAGTPAARTLVDRGTQSATHS